MSEFSLSGAPVAGWYPDPGEPSVLRYWDGAQWTHHLQPAPQQLDPAPGPDWLTNRNAILMVLALALLITVAFVALG